MYCKSIIKSKEFQVCLSFPVKVFSKCFVSSMRTLTLPQIYTVPTHPSVLSAPGCVVCWTYHASQNKMDWEEARIFCKTSYTDLVAIQNEKETEHLLNIQDIVPHRDSSPHYWIGIRKINETWTWIGTNKKLTGYESWDSSEPNSRFPNEDCVEIYINQQIKKGKWNDMSCSQKNYAICYKGKRFNAVLDVFIHTNTHTNCQFCLFQPNAPKKHAPNRENVWR